jgi:dephospho-CoA kinase
MLRVGLTGGLGSGKTTAAQMFAAKGAHVFSADEIARELMQPGEAVYSAIVTKFGPGIVAADGLLDRAALARIAFGVSGNAGRIKELEAIVHPATIARQAELIAELEALDPDAVAVVESALIFETKYGGEGGWHRRFDAVILVTAPEELRIARFVQRMASGKALNVEDRAGLEAEARRRLANQVNTERNAAQCRYVLKNDGSLEELQRQVDRVWPLLKDAARQRI